MSATTWRQPGSDYVTSVQKGGFYGWPYYYIGGNLDARLGEPHPELRSKVIVPTC